MHDDKSAAEDQINRSAGIARELGTALAVLGVFVLTLLLPIHQAAGLQRDLARLGFESTVSLSVCGPVAEGQSNDVPTAVKCPATGIAKHDFAGPVPVELVVAVAVESMSVRYADDRDVAVFSQALGVGQPRAPPMAG